jgi:uncharacterized PurR-regulated membrane protein YhhQ (DUF165 family)
MIIKHLFRYKATLAYVVLIVFINSLFCNVPEVSVFAHSFSPADIAVGFIYIFRDFAQREIRSYVLFAMLLGGVLSYLFAESAVATASLCAFFVGEIIDWLIFTWTRKPLSQRLLWSALCSSPLDSLVFLSIAGHLQWLDLILMTLMKFCGVFVVWLSWQLRANRMARKVLVPIAS